MAKVVVYISGGNVQDVVADELVTVFIVDSDNGEASDKPVYIDDEPVEIATRDVEGGWAKTVENVEEAYHAQ